MRFIENPDLREWVKESLRRAVFQKAHELAVQTGCEVLVKLQDMADHSGQYYATRTLHLQYQGKGLSKQPWDVKVSGVTGLPETVLVEKGCQSDGKVVKEEADSEVMDDEDVMMTETDSGLLEQESNLVASVIVSHSKSGIYSAESEAQTRVEVRTDGSPLDVKVEEQGHAPYDESCQSSVQRDNYEWGRDRIPPRSGECNQPTSGECEIGKECTSDEQGTHSFHDSVDDDGALSTRLPFRSAATYPIGFPINKLQALTKSVDTRIQTPFPSQVLADLEGTAQNPLEMTQSADNAGVVTPALKPYQCGICRKTFGSIQILSRHAQMNHGLDRRMNFLCDVCGQGYKQAQHLQRHMRMHRTVMPYICTICNKGFFNGTSLTKHEKTHERLNERHKCRACLKFFPQIIDLQEHFKKVHGGPGIKSSNQSSQIFTPAEIPSSETLLDSWNSAEQIADKTSGQSAECDRFPPNLSLLPGPSMTRPIFPQNMQNTNDGQSDSVSPSSTEEQSQEKEGNPQMSWQDMTSSIADSDSSTPTSSVVNIHGGIRQTSSFLRNIGLFSTGSQSSNLFRFNRHVCHLCGKSYKYNFTLKEHLLTHASVPQFVCKICGTAFTRQRQLRDHMFRHSGTYPYHCELCGKGFIRPSTMKRHQTDRHRMLHNDVELN